MIRASEAEADELAKKYWDKESKQNHTKGTKNVSKKKAVIIMKDRTSSQVSLPSGKIGAKNRNHLNCNNGMKKASQKKATGNVEEQISRQKIQPSKKRSCLTIVPKKTSNKTDSMRSTKKKRMYVTRGKIRCV